MTPIHIQILEFLNCRGIGKQCDITSVIKPWLQDQENLYDVAFLSEKDNIDKILNSMAEQKLLDQVNNLYDYDSSVKCSITPFGFDYLAQKQLLYSSIDLNDSTKRNSETQKKHSIITILVAVIAAIGSISSIGISIYDRSQSELQLQSFRKEITLLKSEQNRLQNLLTSVQDSSHKQRPPFSNTLQTTSDKK